MNIISTCMKQAGRICMALLLVIVSTQASAQFRIVDKADGQPIAGAYIFDQDNKLLCMSDADGNVKALSGIVTINILSYQPKTVDASTTKGDVALEQNALTLPEVVVKRSDYIKISTAFRDICTNNGKAILYREGLADFYINIKTGKIKRRVWACRQYEYKKLRKFFNFDTYMLSGNSTNLARVGHIKTDSVSSYKGDTTYLASTYRNRSASDALMIIHDKKRGLYREVVDNTKFKNRNNKYFTLSTNISDWTFSQEEESWSSLVSFRGILEYTWKWEKKDEPIVGKEMKDLLVTGVTTLDKATAEKEMKDKSETDEFTLPANMPAVPYNASEQIKGLEKRKFWEQY